MTFLLWLMRIMSGLGVLLAIILALVHSWADAGQSLFVALLLYLASERIASARRARGRSPGAPTGRSSTGEGS